MSPFTPESRPDSSDLLAEARRSYGSVESLEELRTLDPDTVETLLCLFAESSMGTVAELGTALGDMTASGAVSPPSKPGRVLPHGGERGSGPAVPGNADAATITADYQSQHRETLVPVTGDHETGGIGLTYDADRETVMQYASIPTPKRFSHCSLRVRRPTDSQGLSRTPALARSF